MLDEDNSLIHTNVCEKIMQLDAIAAKDLALLKIVL